MRSQVGRGHRALLGKRRKLSPGLVRAMTVVDGIDVEHASRVGLVQEQQVIEELAPQCPDDPFAVGVHPR